MRDKLSYGHIEISSEFLGMESVKKANCKNFKNLTKFNKGEVDFTEFIGFSSNEIQCVRIVIDAQQKSWVAITEIAIFTHNQSTTASLEYESIKKNISHT